jgi:hypothetical protein
VVERWTDGAEAVTSSVTTIIFRLLHLRSDAARAKLNASQSVEVIGRVDGVGVCLGVGEKSRVSGKFVTKLAGRRVLLGGPYVVSQCGEECALGRCDRVTRVDRFISAVSNYINADNSNDWLAERRWESCRWPERPCSDAEHDGCHNRENEPAHFRDGITQSERCLDASMRVRHVLILGWRSYNKPHICHSTDNHKWGLPTPD